MRRCVWCGSAARRVAFEPLSFEPLLTEYLCVKCERSVIYDGDKEITKNQGEYVNIPRGMVLSGEKETKLLDYDIYLATADLDEVEDKILIMVDNSKQIDGSLRCGVKRVV